jgi:ligand-binding sensor domain-containing protein/signal transduction histidine kinase
MGSITHNLFLSCLAACLFLNLCASVTMANELENKAILASYSSDTWDTRDGLPGNHIRAMTQGRDGYIWIGTELGLVRFDGIKFHHFEKGAPLGVGYQDVIRLRPAKDGGLWIALKHGGIFYHKDGIFTFYNLESELKNRFITDIFEDKDHRLWVGTKGRGLFTITNGRINKYTAKDGISNNWVEDIFEDRAGRLWFGTPDGLFSHKNGSFLPYEQGDLSGKFIRTLYEDRSGTLWVGTNRTLYSLRDGKLEGFPTPGRVIAIHEDSQRQLWIGLGNKGLHLFQNGKSLPVIKGSIFPDNNTTSIFQDKEENLWVGTRLNGLVRLRKNKFRTYSTDEGIANRQIEAIGESRDGSIWIGTRDGLTRMKNGQTELFRREQGLTSSYIRTIVEDQQGKLWIGTSDGGLLQYSDGRFRVLDIRSGLPDNKITATLVDKDDTLWIASGEQIIKWRDRKTDIQRAERYQVNTLVRTMSQKENGIWAGTDKGLVAINGETLTHYSTRNGLPDDRIRTLYTDSRGTLWIGTYGGGLTRYRNGRFHTYTKQQGLPSNSITSIMEKGQQLWIGSREGIFSISRKTIEDFDQGRTKRIHCDLYDTTDGLKSNVCAAGPQTAFVARDGRYWFATDSGISVYDPKLVKRTSIAPEVYIESLLIDGLSVNHRTEAILDPGKRFIEIHYTGLSFAAPEKVSFKYKLEGFDNEWREAGTRRVATYSGLPPGNYTFRVAAVNNEGIWNISGATLSFTLRPHFYQTYWFYALLMAIIISAGIFLHARRIRSVKAKHELVLAERTRISRDLHDSIEQGLAGITLQIDTSISKFFDSPDVSHRSLTMARNMLAQARAEIRRAIWNLRSHTLDKGDLYVALSEVAQQQTMGSRVKCDIRLLTPLKSVPPGVEDEFLRIGQEAITNAIKHARATEIKVELSSDFNAIKMRVHDNGCGFDTGADRKSGSFGLVGMQERARNLSGQLSIKSRQGAGTDIMVIAPLKKEKTG